jgi:CheY-like chemotaxis protein
VRVEAGLARAPIYINADGVRIAQVLTNLLANAVKFTPAGGIATVSVSSDPDGHAVLRVRDTGAGIEPELLPRMFEPFVQVDRPIARSGGGLGLGLALVKHLVELHGGSVEAQSAGEGKGATFIVRLPLMIADIPPGPVLRVHPTASSPESLPGARLDGLRVLLVDDDPDSVDLATAILAGAGADVLACRSAAEALQAIQAWRPDVLVSDIEMPEEDGYSLIRNVRALDPGNGGKTPAVALTAYGRTQDRMQSLTAGYSMHVPKPVDPGELTTIIASLAARPARAQ